MTKGCNQGASNIGQLAERTRQEGNMEPSISVPEIALHEIVAGLPEDFENAKIASVFGKGFLSATGPLLAKRRSVVSEHKDGPGERPPLLTLAGGGVEPKEVFHGGRTWGEVVVAVASRELREERGAGNEVLRSTMPEHQEISYSLDGLSRAEVKVLVETLDKLAQINNKGGFALLGRLEEARNFITGALEILPQSLKVLEVLFMALNTKGSIKVIQGNKDGQILIKTSSENAILSLDESRLYWNDVVGALGQTDIDTRLKSAYLTLGVNEYSRRIAALLLQEAVLVRRSLLEQIASGDLFRYPQADICHRGILYYLDGEPHFIQDNLVVDQKRVDSLLNHRGFQYSLGFLWQLYETVTEEDDKRQESQQIEIKYIYDLANALGLGEALQDMGVQIPTCDNCGEEKGVVSTEDFILAAIGLVLYTGLLHRNTLDEFRYAPFLERVIVNLPKKILSRYRHSYRRIGWPDLEGNEDYAKAWAQHALSEKRYYNPLFSGFWNENSLYNLLDAHHAISWASRLLGIRLGFNSIDRLVILGTMFGGLGNIFQTEHYAIFRAREEWFVIFDPFATEAEKSHMEIDAANQGKGKPNKLQYAIISDVLNGDVIFSGRSVDVVSIGLLKDSWENLIRMTLMPPGIWIDVAQQAGVEVQVADTLGAILTDLDRQWKKMMRAGGLRKGMPSQTDVPSELRGKYSQLVKLLEIPDVDNYSWLEVILKLAPAFLQHRLLEELDNIAAKLNSINEGQFAENELWETLTSAGESPVIMTRYGEIRSIKPLDIGTVNEIRRKLSFMEFILAFGIKGVWGAVANGSLIHLARLYLALTEAWIRTALLVETGFEEAPLRLYLVLTVQDNRHKSPILWFIRSEEVGHDTCDNPYGLSLTVNGKNIFVPFSQITYYSLGRVHKVSDRSHVISIPMIGQNNWDGKRYHHESWNDSIIRALLAKARGPKPESSIIPEGSWQAEEDVILQVKPWDLEKILDPWIRPWVGEVLSSLMLKLLRKS